MLPSAAQAQNAVTLGEISVVSTSPVGSGGGNSSRVQNLNGPGGLEPAGSAPPPIGPVRLSTLR